MPWAPPSTLGPPFRWRTGPGGPGFFFAGWAGPRPNFFRPLFPAPPPRALPPEPFPAVRLGAARPPPPPKPLPGPPVRENPRGPGFPRGNRPRAPPGRPGAENPPRAPTAETPVVLSPRGFPRNPPLALQGPGRPGGFGAPYKAPPPGQAGSGRPPPPGAPLAGCPRFRNENRCAREVGIRSFSCRGPPGMPEVRWSPVFDQAPKSCVQVPPSTIPTKW